MESFMTNFSEIWNKIRQFSCKRMNWNMTSSNLPSFWFGLNMLAYIETLKNRGAITVTSKWARCNPTRGYLTSAGMHHGTCVTHVPWCMSGSLTHGGGENAPDIPGACATRNCEYLARGPFGDDCDVMMTAWKRVSAFVTCGFPSIRVIDAEFSVSLMIAG